MPKRAETFAGFDTSFEVPKRESIAPDSIPHESLPVFEVFRHTAVYGVGNWVLLKQAEGV